MASVVLTWYRKGSLWMFDEKTRSVLENRQRDGLKAITCLSIYIIMSAWLWFNSWLVNICHIYIYIGLLIHSITYYDQKWIFQCWGSSFTYPLIFTIIYNFSQYLFNQILFFPFSCTFIILSIYFMVISSLKIINYCSH